MTNGIILLYKENHNSIKKNNDGLSDRSDLEKPIFFENFIFFFSGHTTFV